jgi:hypothetical protein
MNKTKSGPDEAPIETSTVNDLLRVQGFPPIGNNIAERIAVGASNAVAAVLAARRGSLFDSEPSSFLSELERLSDDDHRA